MYLRKIKLLKGQINDLDPAHIAHIYFNDENGTLFVLQPARKRKLCDTYDLTGLEINIGRKLMGKTKQMSLFSVPLQPNKYEHKAHKQYKSKINIRFSEHLDENQISLVSESNTVAAILVFIQFFEDIAQPFPWLIRNPHSPAITN